MRLCLLNIMAGSSNGHKMLSKKSVNQRLELNPTKMRGLAISLNDVSIH